MEPSICTHSCCVVQVQCFYTGLMDVADVSVSDKRLLLPLTHADVDALLGGQPGDLCATAWQAATDVVGFSSGCLVLEWFWQVVEALTPSRRRQLLRFWTGICYLPAGGFSSLGQRLQITALAGCGSYSSNGTVHLLPQAHTCFLQLALPTRYSTAAEVAQAIDVALDHVGAFALQ